MTRPRSFGVGPHRPDRHRSPSTLGAILPFVAAAALLASGCGGATTSVVPGPSSAPADASAEVLESEVPATTGPAASDPTTAEPTQETMEEPTESPSSPAAATASANAEPATDCTGTSENKAFYESVAMAVAWTVYCPVLPSGWFVESGQYRLAGNGRLEITYRGPDGERFALEEGVWCTDASGCVPSGSDLGAAAFGDREGTLIATDDGDFAIVVDPGSTTSWSLVGDGLDDGQVRTIGAALIAVGG